MQEPLPVYACLVLEVMLSYTARAVLFSVLKLLFAGDVAIEVSAL